MENLKPSQRSNNQIIARMILEELRDEIRGAIKEEIQSAAADDLMTVTETANYLKCSETRVYELCQHKPEDFPAFKPGKRYVIPRSRLLEWMYDNPGLV